MDLSCQKEGGSSIERFKACLVAKGFHQQKGVDFTEALAQWLNQRQFA